MPATESWIVPGLVRIDVTGHVDAATAPELAAVIASALERGSECIVVDVAGAGAVGVPFAEVLEEASRHASGARLLVLGASPALQDQLEYFFIRRPPANPIDVVPEGLKPRRAELPGEAAALVRRVWAAVEQERADELSQLLHPEVELRSHAGDGRRVRGRDAVLAGLARRPGGDVLERRAYTFEEHGDVVIVHGSERSSSSPGAFSETQVHWRFEIRDGRAAFIDLFGDRRQAELSENDGRDLKIPSEA